MKKWALSPISRGGILVVLARDSDARRLKRLLWGRSRTTDVIAFSDPDPEPGMPGLEIVVNVDQAGRQAAGPLEEELVFLFIHGLLHHLGWKDATAVQRRRMLAFGEKILDSA